MEKLESLLKESGFTEYETRTFLILTQYGVCTADDVSRLANIPLPRVYDTLGQLEKKGFVMTTKTRPQKCKALDFKESYSNFLDNKKKMVESEINTLKQKVTEINDDLFSSNKLNKPKKEELRLWSMKGKKNLVNMKRDYLKKAKKEILMFTGDASFINEDFELLKNIMKNGVKTKILMREPLNEDVKESLERLSELGTKIKSGFEGSLRGFIIDNSAIIIMLKYGKNEGIEAQLSYEGIIVNNPLFVKSLIDYFKLAWNSR